jgi:hypothetical protein
MVIIAHDHNDGERRFDFELQVIPLSDKTRGHGSHTIAALWKNELETLLKNSAEK